MALVKVLWVEFSCFLIFKSKPTDFKIDGSLHKGAHLRLTWQEPCLLPLGLSCQVSSFITEHTAEPGTRHMFMKISSIERHELCHPRWVIAPRELSQGFPDRSDGKECPCVLHPALEVAGISQSGFIDWKIKAIRGSRLGEVIALKRVWLPSFRSQPLLGVLHTKVLSNRSKLQHPLVLTARQRVPSLLLRRIHSLLSALPPFSLRVFLLIRNCFLSLVLWHTHQTEYQDKCVPEQLQQMGHSLR